MATTKIATESARPSLAQNLEDVYSKMHAGGAFDAKKDVIINGDHNHIVAGIQSQKQTPKGFKTKMSEQQTEFYMGRDSKVTTTRMKTSIYGNHSTIKYKR